MLASYVLMTGWGLRIGLRIEKLCILTMASMNLHKIEPPILPVWIPDPSGLAEVPFDKAPNPNVCAA